MAKITFDENTLTIGDLEDFEDAIGVELTEALKPVSLRDEEGVVVRHDCANDDHECSGDPCKDAGRPVQTVKMTAKVLKGLVWIASRQDDPTFTLADARNVKVTELDIVRLDEESETPAEAADPKD